MKMKNLLMAALVIGGVALNSPAADTPKKTRPRGTNTVTRTKAAKPVNSTVAVAKAETAEPALEPGPYVANEKNVNVRGQAAINSEVVVHLKKGDKVTVLEEIALKKHGKDEPARWAKIALPESTHVWVHSMFVDSTTKTVKAKKLNLRSGPGENYSVVGRLEQGAEIKEIETKGEWIKIAPPAGSYAFVAAHLLSKETPVAVIAAATPTPLPTPRVNTPPPVPVPAPVPTPPPTSPTQGVVSEPVLVTTSPASVTVNQPIQPVRTAPPVPVPTPPIVPAPAPVTPPVDLAATTKPVVEKPAPVEEVFVPRVVTREGLVRRSVSIQAPTFFVLENLSNGKTMNYLHSATTNLVLREFNGQRVIVTGEEALDERWPHTPVIEVETLQAVP